MSGDDDLSAGILLLPHHGRANRLLPELLRRVEPHTVIISGSGAPASRRTARELERRGYAVYSTWRGGAVLSTWRDGRWSTRQPNAPGATAYSP